MSKCDISKLVVGDRLSRISYMTIVEDLGPAVKVENEDGFNWTIGKGILEQEATTANQFETVSEVTATELATLLEGAGETIFTVVFTKQPLQKDVASALDGLTAADVAKKTQRDRLAREFLAGPEREMVGYLVTTEPKLGRSQVLDLEAKGLRLVDHRTIQSLVLRNVKYVLKK